jgi:pyochelin synthetase
VPDPAPERYGTESGPVTRNPGQGAATPVAPAVLEALTGILADFTDVPVTPDSTFGELEATSLTLVLTHRRLRESIAPHLALADMFEHPTVAALAARITAQCAPDTDRTAAAAGAAEPPTSRQSERPTRRTSRVAARALAEETAR